jgi:hypothetical protein
MTTHCNGCHVIQPCNRAGRRFWCVDCFPKAATRRAP